MTDTIAHVVDDRLDTGKPYSTATIAQGFIFLSGLIPAGDVSQVTKMSVEQQIAAVFGDAERVLRICGSSIRSIVKASCYLTDSGHFAMFNEVYARHMETPFPARTTVVTRLAAPGALFEMDVVAVLDQDRTDGCTR